MILAHNEFVVVWHVASASKTESWVPGSLY